jgi:hypothetical protein
MIGSFKKIFSLDPTVLTKMKGISTMLLVLIVLTMKMTFAQVVYQADYDDSTCSTAPFRYSTYTTTCLNGCSAVQCDTKAYLRLCNNCNANSTCFTENLGTPVDTCFGSSSSGTKTSCSPIVTTQPSSYVTYVEYKHSGCGTRYTDTPATYNQTKFNCANNGLDSIKCLSDGTGVTYTLWGGGSNCGVVQSTTNYQFGACVEVIPGSLYRTFTACVGSGAQANMDGKNMFMLLVGVLMSSFVLMGAV